EEDPVLEKAIISGVAHTDCEPLFRVREIDAAKLFARLADAGINVDTILQVSSDEIVFSAPLDDRSACEDLLSSLEVEWSMRDDLGKVSLVGAGMKSHPGIAAQAFATLGGIGVQPEVISTSPIKIASPAHVYLTAPPQDRLPRPYRGRAEGGGRAARRLRARSSVTARDARIGV